jgi:hypothetical protein
MSAESQFDVFSVRIRSGLSDTCPFTCRIVSQPPNADQIGDGDPVVSASLNYCALNKTLNTSG